jgi:hypothetical protein
MYFTAYDLSFSLAGNETNAEPTAPVRRARESRSRPGDITWKKTHRSLEIV